MSTPWALAVAFLLIAINGFFVAVEFALLGSRRSVVEPMAESSPRAAKALAAMSDLNRQLSGAQLGITIASLALGFVAEPAIGSLLESFFESYTSFPSGVQHTVSFIIALTLVSFLHMVLGEMVPKNVTLAGPERAAVVLLPFHARVVSLFRPVIWLVNALSVGVVRLFKIEPTDELRTTHTAVEFSHMVDASKGEGLIGEFSHELISSALEYKDRSVASIMVPWAQVDVLNRLTSVAEIEKEVVRSGHSRLPIFDASSAVVEGYVHAKDLLATTESERSSPVPDDKIHQMVVLRAESTLDEGLRAMRRRQTHMALVRDGSNRLGLLTLEDIVEQIVGEIHDETDL
ncbi:MAG: hemolysin family protein [Acidimicrobiales bacterium]|jgi:CBS domain containing-hemolysin-like protein